MSWDDSDDDWENSNLILPGAKKEVEEPKEEFSDEEEVVEEDEHVVEAPKTKKADDGKKKQKKKKSMKQLEAEKEAQLQLEKEMAAKMEAMTPAEKMAEKLRLQKLVEESDNKLTDELFAKKEDGIFDEDVVAATLQSIPLDNEQHFKNFASAIGKRLELEDKTLRTREFEKKKKSMKQLEAEKEAQLQLEKEMAAKMEAMTPAEKMAEKLRLQKLVEESDNKLTDELFAKKEDGIFDEDVVAATLQSIPLDNEQHFKNFASAIGKRLELEDKTLRTREFVKELLRSVAPTLPYEDLQEIDSVLSVVKNTKVKKTLNKKKKKTTKTFAKVQRDMFDYDETTDFNGGDDFDFM
eukprot:CAMPEP_0204843438 /NCGR_PEP_ID=MMETSP1346-20131115/47980_1 /ASSEMBLY_ACC=CAM_ASM_000771 /TAXON_ID=215587 /ORGANISM="Aplanochytrium stocchinoi, Strain GSBS06" /LENGTH=351 /DNA_ID=CAMNT_0051982583 /DNA_START=301 /DNA_END=1358 /DNA_ORIENTATION=+